MRNVFYVLALFTIWQSCATVKPIDYSVPTNITVKEMEFKWPDGTATIHGKLLDPGNFEKLVIIAGPGGPNPVFIESRLIDSLLANDIAVLTYDERGTGLSTGDFNASGYFDLAADLTLIARTLRRSFGLGIVIGVIGIEDGGWKAMIASNYDRRIEFLNLIGTSALNWEQWVEEQIKKDPGSWRFRREKPEQTLEHYREIHRILSTRRKPEMQLAELDKYLDGIKVSGRRRKQITSPLFMDRIRFVTALYAGKNMPMTMAVVEEGETSELAEWNTMASVREQIEVRTISQLYGNDEKESISDAAIGEILSWLLSHEIREND